MQSMRFLPLHLPPSRHQHPAITAMRAIMESLEKNKRSAFRKPEFIRGSGRKRDQFRGCSLILQMPKSVLVGALRIPSLKSLLCPLKLCDLGQLI